jgi:glycosyltransferase involved in cell wall biosynthesis
MDERPRSGCAFALVAARDEADRVGATVEALRAALPDVGVVVADDGSQDDSSLVAMAAARSIEDRLGADDIVLLCDGDLGTSAARLSELVAAVEDGACDLAVGAFSRRQGGGFGVALGFARWAIRNLTGRTMSAPISGQRAMRAPVLRATLPFARGFGMEIGVTVDALRAGFEVSEVELDLEHRATGRSVAGFRHRGRQLLDFLRVYVSRKLGVRSRRDTLQ